MVININMGVPEKCVNVCFNDRLPYPLVCIMDFHLMDKQLHMLRYELMFLSLFSIIGLDREKNISWAVCEAHNLKFLKCLLSGGTWIQGDCCKRITKHDSGHRGCSRRKRKVHGLLLSSQRLMSVGTRSKTHQRQALRECMQGCT